MDVEPQYPVDAATQDAMQDGAGGGGATDATNAANLDEYMRESGGVKKSVSYTHLTLPTILLV